MPAQSRVYNPLFTPTSLISSPSSTTTPSDDAHSLDSKARTEYERDRQKARKPHDIRKTYHHHHQHQHHHHLRAAPAAATTPAKRHLGLGHWKNLADMELTTPTAAATIGPDSCPNRDDLEDSGKENSRLSSNSLSIALEDFVVVRPPSGAAHKPRKSVSRSSLSRHASADSNALATLSPALALVSLSSPPSPSSRLHAIHEQHRHHPSASPSPSLLPMLASSPYRTLSPLEEDETDFSEFSSPGADDWMMDETEDGCLRYVCSSMFTVMSTTTHSKAAAAASPSESSIIVVESCVW